MDKYQNIKENGKHKKLLTLYLIKLEMYKIILNSFQFAFKRVGKVPKKSGEKTPEP